jgi:hypothetical protein
MVITKDVLSLWAGAGGEGAKFWAACWLIRRTAAWSMCSSPSATG